MGKTKKNFFFLMASPLPLPSLLLALPFRFFLRLPLVRSRKKFIGRTIKSSMPLNLQCVPFEGRPDGLELSNQRGLKWQWKINIFAASPFNMLAYSNYFLFMVGPLRWGGGEPRLVTHTCFYYSLVYYLLFLNGRTTK